METSYLARRDGKKLLLINDYQIRKISDIGYNMNRMNMSSNDRYKKARNQVDVHFKKKYGEKYNEILMNSYIPKK